MPASDYLSVVQHQQKRYKKKNVVTGWPTTNYAHTSGGLPLQYGFGFDAGGPGWWGENTFTTSRGGDDDDGGDDGGE